MNTLQWLTKLISFNSISNQSNLPLIEAMDDWLKQHNIDSKILYDHTKSKANLFATIPAHNGQIQGGLMLSAHTDVVPVAGQIWDTDPFVITEKDGLLYGRGTCDMKGFIAVVLALVPEFKSLKLLKPIHFAFSYDEEIGCIGADYLVEYLTHEGIKPEACIVGEPSNMQPIIGEKARQVYHCQIDGLSAHSSLPGEGCNAIEYASRLICYIKIMADNIKEKGPFDHDFDLPYTTVTTTIVSGGIASNVIPGNCEFIFEIRYLPEFSTQTIINDIEKYIDDELLPEMKNTYPQAAIYLAKTSDASGFIADDSATIIDVVRRITGVSKRMKVSYATEAGIFEEAGIPTVVCGPGDIEQAHRPNEYISLEQLQMCETMLQEIVHSFCVSTSFDDRG